MSNRIAVVGADLLYALPGTPAPCLPHVRYGVWEKQNHAQESDHNIVLRYQDMTIEDVLNEAKFEILIPDRPVLEKITLEYSSADMITVPVTATFEPKVTIEVHDLGVYKGHKCYLITQPFRTHRRVGNQMREVVDAKLVVRHMPKFGRPSVCYSYDTAKQCIAHVNLVGVHQETMDKIERDQLCGLFDFIHQKTSLILQPRIDAISALIS